MRRLHTVDDGERSRLQAQLATELEADPAVAFAYLYGSFVEARPFHDVDVGVYLRAPQSPGAGSADLAMAQRLSERIGFPVDVRVLNAAPVSFRYHALRGRLLVCRDDDLLARVMEDTIRRYLDMAPLLRRSTKEAFAE